MVRVEHRTSAFDKPRLAWRKLLLRDVRVVQLLHGLHNLQHIIAKHEADQVKRISCLSKLITNLICLEWDSIERPYAIIHVRSTS